MWESFTICSVIIITYALKTQGFWRFILFDISVFSTISPRWLCAIVYFLQKNRDWVNHTVLVFVFVVLCAQVLRASCIVYYLFICVYNNSIFNFLWPLQLRKLYRHIALQRYFSTFSWLECTPTAVTTSRYSLTALQPKIYNNCNSPSMFFNGFTTESLLLTETNPCILFFTDLSYIFFSYSACFPY